MALGTLPRLTSVSAAVLLVGLFASDIAVAAIAVSPQAKIVALAFDATNHVLIKASPRELYRSRNDGQNWESVALPAAVARGRITSVSVAAKSQEQVLYLAGRGFGILRSTDGGNNWSAKNDGLPSKDVIAMSAHADRPTTLYVSLAGRRLFRSEDGGSHWRLMDAGPREQVVQLVHSNMPGSMQTGWFFAATARGVGRSMDCFCGWRDAGELRQPVSAVAYDPQEPKRVYAATAEALWVSIDGGERWSQVRSPGRGITALVVTPEGVVYAAVNDGELFGSADHGSNWRRVGA